jgi:hypothetical protein
VELLIPAAIVAPDQRRESVNTIIQNVNDTIARINAVSNKENANRVLQAITQVPPNGAMNNINAIRVAQVGTFTGEPTNSSEVIGWLDRARGAAVANDLSHAATIELLKVCSSGGASLYIRQLHSGGSTLEEIIRAFETRYGDLCPPEEAHIKCNTMPRRPNESLTAFIDRLRSMAEIATRMMPLAQKNREIEAIVVRNIPRVLPGSVKQMLHNKQETLSNSALGPMDSREMEKSCLEWESQRQDRRAADQPRGARAQAVQVAESSTDDTSSSEEPDDEHEVYANAIQQMEKRYRKMGKQPQMDKVLRRADRYVAKWKNNRPTHANYAQGPPNKLSDKPGKNFAQMLQDAKVNKGECLQCGQPGHNARSDACGLRGKPLVDRACAVCGKGLHNPDDCPRVYQKQGALNE